MTFPLFIYLSRPLSAEAGSCSQPPAAAPLATNLKVMPERHIKRPLPSGFPPRWPGRSKRRSNARVCWVRERGFLIRGC